VEDLAKSPKTLSSFKQQRGKKKKQNQQSDGSGVTNGMAICKFTRYL